MAKKVSKPYKKTLEVPPQENGERAYVEVEVNKVDSMIFQDNITDTVAEVYRDRERRLRRCVSSEGAREDDSIYAPTFDFNNYEFIGFL